MASSTMRYVIMPREGFEHPGLVTAMLLPKQRSIKLMARSASVARPKMRVLDTIGENGPKLVETSTEGELSLRLSHPELKVVPLIFYQRAWYRPAVEQRPGRAAVASRTGKTRKTKTTAARVNPAKATPSVEGSTITVMDRQTGKPLRGAYVLLFTEFASRTGDHGPTDANGMVYFDAISSTQPLERAYIYGPGGYWGHFEANTSAEAVRTVRLEPIDVSGENLLLRQLYGALPPDAGAGVKVGIIDTGIDGTHPDLGNVSGGINCVGDEVRATPGANANWGPAKMEGEHGTHVAGIVGGTGKVSGFRGVAPGVTLRSYRVFPDDGSGANNFDIAKAIDAAITDGCDLINMSLGGGSADDLVAAAIDRALEAGVTVMAAAGNDGRGPVCFPAALPECVAISAMGRLGAFPAESIGSGSIAKPVGGPGARDFFADFSNIGPQVDLTGPGVEIVSTLPGGHFGAMNGTSMATPAVTGFAAYLLTTDQAALCAKGRVRTQRVKDLLFRSCQPEKFGRDYEGFGLPLPRGSAVPVAADEAGPGKDLFG